MLRLVNPSCYNTYVESYSVFSARRILPSKIVCWLIKSLRPTCTNACFLKFNIWVITSKILSVDDWYFVVINFHFILRRQKHKYKEIWSSLLWNQREREREREKERETPVIRNHVLNGKGLVWWKLNYLMCIKES